MLEGQQTRREQSPFEELLEKAANTPIIWETIMSNISGADVANCLKVCKGLRHLIKQCMNENSRFCQQMHVAAAASALGKGWTRSKITHRIAFVPPNFLVSVFGLDDAWYNGTRKVIRKVDPHGKVINATLPEDKEDYIYVFPTMDESRLFMELNERLILLEKDHHQYTLIPDGETAVGQEKRPQGLCCIQYRLFALDGFKENNNVTILMRLLNNNGHKHKDVTLYQLEHRDGSNMYTQHQQSNEEVRHEFTHLSITRMTKIWTCQI